MTIYNFLPIYRVLRFWELIFGKKPVLIEGHCFLEKVSKIKFCLILV